MCVMAASHTLSVSDGNLTGSHSGLAGSDNDFDRGIYPATNQTIIIISN